MWLLQRGCVRSSTHLSRRLLLVMRNDFSVNALSAFLSVGRCKNEIFLQKI